MKSRKFVIMIVVFLTTIMLISCHHNTCPTFGKVDMPQLEECV